MAQIPLRLPDDLKAQLAARSSSEGRSQNAIACDALSGYLDRTVSISEGVAMLLEDTAGKLSRIANLEEPGIKHWKAALCPETRDRILALRADVLSLAHELAPDLFPSLPPVG